MSAASSPAHEASKSAYPDLSDEMASPTDSVIAGDFGAMSAEEQERQRDEWKDELRKTEEEIMTLRQVLASKEAHAYGLKRRLGITAWREFSEDMTQGLKTIQDSAAYKKTAEGLNVAQKKTSELWTSVTSSQGFQSVSGKVGSVFGAAKSKMSSSFSQQNIGSVLEPGAQSAAAAAEPAEEAKSAQNGDKAKAKADSK